MDVFLFLKTYGWLGFIGVGVLLLLYKFFSEYIEKWAAMAAAKILQHKKEENIKMHEFFTSIDYNLNVIVPTMVLFEDKPVRQTLLKDLVHYSLLATSDVANQIVAVDQSSWTAAKWTHEMQSALNQINESFLKMCDDHGIPEIVYNKFLNWYFIRLNYFRSTIQQIGGSDIYSTMELKTFTFFGHLNSFISLMTLDAEQTLRDLNGDITGLIYKKGTIEALAEDHH